MQPSAHGNNTSNSGDDDDEFAVVVPTRMSCCRNAGRAIYHAAAVTDEELASNNNRHSILPSTRSSSSGSATSKQRSAIIVTASLLFASILIFVTGYVAGERHEQRIVGLGKQPLVADENLLDADDDTVEAAAFDDDDQYNDDGTSSLYFDDDQDDVDEDNDSENASPSYQRFLVFAEQRSGSRFLTDLLDDHPHVRCGNEELNHPGSSLGLKHLSLDDYMTALDVTYDRLLQQPSRNSPLGQSKAIGFKVMYDQGVEHYGKDLMAKLDEANIKVIHLVRRNKLLQYISCKSNEEDKHMKEDDPTAKHQAHPTTKEEAERIRDEITVSGKPEKVLHFMQVKTEEDTRVSNLISAHLDPSNYAFVDYEDLSVNTEVEMARLFDLLDVEEQRVETKMEKIHEGKQTRSYFKPGQQDALKKALEESEYAWVLDGW